MAAKKGKLRHIHIEPNSDKTAQVKVHRAPAPRESKDTGSPFDYEGNDESFGAGTPEEAGAHVTRILKENMGQKSSDGDSDDYSSHPMKAAFGAKSKSKY
jgi:hypothetical protein